MKDFEKILNKAKELEASMKEKQEQIKKLHEKAFQAQRNGDLSLAGDYQKQAEEIADSILNSKHV